MQRGAVLLDMVSLFPAENGVEGSVSPFRSDILSLLKGLKPRRVPPPPASCGLVPPPLGCLAGGLQVPVLGMSEVRSTEAEWRALCRFLRFPGGCYVEGVVMANGFYWKPSVGPLDQRPGHWNGMWQYWSTDGEHTACWRLDVWH